VATDLGRREVAFGAARRSPPGPEEKGGPAKPPAVRELAGPAAGCGRLVQAGGVYAGLDGEVDGAGCMPWPPAGVDGGFDVVEVHAGSGEGDEGAAAGMPAFHGGDNLAGGVTAPGVGVVVVPVRVAELEPVGGWWAGPGR
jgi:hypothetical protein